MQDAIHYGPIDPDGAYLFCNSEQRTVLREEGKYGTPKFAYNFNFADIPGTFKIPQHLNSNFEDL